MIFEKFPWESSPCKVHTNTWEIVTLEVALRKMPLGKYPTPGKCPLDSSLGKVSWDDSLGKVLLSKFPFFPKRL